MDCRVVLFSLLIVAAATASAADGVILVPSPPPPENIRVMVDRDPARHTADILKATTAVPPAVSMLASGEQLRGMYSNPAAYREFVRASLNPIINQFVTEERLNKDWATYSSRVSAYELDNMMRYPWRNPGVELLYEWGGREVVKKGLDTAGGALTGSATAGGGVFGTVVVGGMTTAASTGAMTAIDKELGRGTEARKRILGELVSGLDAETRRSLLVDREAAERAVQQVTNAAPGQIKELLGLTDWGAISVSEMESLAAAVKADPGGFNAARTNKAIAEVRVVKARLDQLGTQLNASMDTLLNKQTELLNISKQALAVGQSTEYKVDALLSLLPPSQQVLAMSRTGALPPGVDRNKATWRDYCNASGRDAALEGPCLQANAQRVTTGLQTAQTVATVLNKLKLLDDKSMKAVADATNYAMAAVNLYVAYQTGDFVSGVNIVNGLLGSGGGPSPEEQLLQKVLAAIDKLDKKLDTIIDLQVQLSSQVQALSEAIQQSTNILYAQNAQVLENVQADFYANYSACLKFARSAQVDFGMHEGLFPNYDARARHFNRQLSATPSNYSPCVAALVRATSVRRASPKSQVVLAPILRYYELSADDEKTGFTGYVYQPMLSITRAWSGLDDSRYGASSDAQLGCEVNLASALATPPQDFFSLRRVPGDCGTDFLAKDLPKQLSGQKTGDPLGLHALGDRLRYSYIHEVSAHLRLLAPYGLLACRDKGGNYTAVLVPTGFTNCSGTHYKLDGTGGADLARDMQVIVMASIAQDSMLSGAYLVPRFYQEWKAKGFEASNADLIAYAAALKQFEDVPTLPETERGEAYKTRSAAVDAARKKLGFTVEEEADCKHSALYYRTLCLASRNKLFQANLVMYTVLMSLQDAKVGYDRSQATIDSSNSSVPGIPSLAPSRPSVAQYSAGLSLDRDWLIRSALPGLPLAPVSASEKDNSDVRWQFEFTDHQGRKQAVDLPSPESVTTGAIAYAPQIVQAVRELNKLQQLEVLLRAKTVADLNLPKDSASALVLAPDAFRIEYFQNAWMTRQPK